MYFETAINADTGVVTDIYVNIDLKSKNHKFPKIKYIH